MLTKPAANKHKIMTPNIAFIIIILMVLFTAEVSLLTAFKERMLLTDTDSCVLVSSVNTGVRVEISTLMIL